MLLIYTIFDNASDSKKICRMLLSENLIACANINENVKSIYKYKGKISESTEISVILKSTTNKKDELINRLEYLHPYDIPCILDISCHSSSNKFTKWIKDIVK